MQEALEPMWTQGAQWDALINCSPSPVGAASVATCDVWKWG